jgi:hypothetical protein
MKKFKLIGMVAFSFIIAGCSAMQAKLPSEPETPMLDAKFGEAVRAARAAMTIDPDAAKKSSTTHSLDGQSANNGVEAYQKSFQTRPVITNESTGGRR